MNLQSGKFCALKRGKLLALPYMNATKRKIFRTVNSSRIQFLKRKIRDAPALKIPRAAEDGTFANHGQTGNWKRAEFPALKIETVENGSIRQ